MVLGSFFNANSAIANASRASSRYDDLPFTAGRSNASQSVTAPLTLVLSKPIPVVPHCHGIEYLLPGSYAGVPEARVEVLHVRDQREVERLDQLGVLHLHERGVGRDDDVVARAPGRQLREELVVGAVVVVGDLDPGLLLEVRDRVVGDVVGPVVEVERLGLGLLASRARRLAASCCPRTPRRSRRPLRTPSSSPNVRRLKRGESVSQMNASDTRSGSLMRSAPSRVRARRRAPR